MQRQAITRCDSKSMRRVSSGRSPFKAHRRRAAQAWIWRTSTSSARMVNEDRAVASLRRFVPSVGPRPLIGLFMSQVRLRARLGLALILLAFVVLAAWSSVLLPLGEAPDELPHFTVTRYIVQHGQLPATADEHEAFQPPLYYLLNALLIYQVDTRDFVVKVNA